MAASRACAPAAALCLAVALALAAGAQAKVYFKETFPADWEKNWKKSSWKVDEGSAGDFVRSAGKYFGDEDRDAGVKTSTDARFYAMTSKFEETFDNTGKDLVLQFSVKHEQGLDCGGGYIKLVPASSSDKIDDFSGDTPYSIMFGPDICGPTKRTHVIFTNKEGKNLLKSSDIPCRTDELTHVYTLIVKPDNTYEVLIDGESQASGALEADWPFLPPQQIDDPEASKPDDWDERPQIADPEDLKPEGWDVPETIEDPKAEKPEDWDDEEDGDWDVPMINNPDYKGEWKPKMIENPDYKGLWTPPKVANPAYVEGSGDLLYQYKDLDYVGFELWQVKAGSIFDNILVADDVEYAAQFAEETTGALMVAEKELKEAEEKKAAEEAEAARIKAEEELAEAEGEEEEEDDDDDDDDDKDEL